MFTLPPSAWYEGPLDNIGTIKTMKECRVITEPLLQHVVAILADLGVPSAHPLTICERLWRPPLRMEYAQYAEIIKSAEATRRFVDAHVIPIVCHYFVDARMEKALEHVDVARVAGSTRYIEWFKTDGIKMVTEDNEAARQLRDQLFKTTYNAIVNQARRYPDIFNLRKTLNAGEFAIDFEDIAIGELGAVPSRVQESTVRRILRIMQLLQTDEAGVKTIDVFNHMSQDVQSFDDFETNAHFIADRFPDMMKITENVQFGDSTMRLLDFSNKRKAEERLDVIVIDIDSDEEEQIEPEQPEQVTTNSVSILEVHAVFQTTLNQVFNQGETIQVPELSRDPEVMELKRLINNIFRLDLCTDIGSHVRRMNDIKGALKGGPLVLQFSVKQNSIFLNGYVTEKNSDLHSLMPRKLSDTFGKPPNSLSRPGFFNGAWVYPTKYKYNLYAVEAYMKVIAYVNRLYAGRTIEPEVPTLDKAIGTLNWDVRFKPQSWLLEAAVVIKFDRYIVAPSKNNPIRAGPSMFEFKRCGMSDSGTKAAIKHLQEKTGGYQNIVTSGNFSDLLKTDSLTCMPVAWASHARLAFKAIDEKKIYFIDPWKQNIRIPKEYVKAASNLGYEVEFVQRAAEQFRGEGSCVFVAFMRMIMCSRTGKAGLTADIDDDYAVLAYHLLSMFKIIKGCKRPRSSSTKPRSRPHILPERRTKVATIPTMDNPVV